MKLSLTLLALSHLFAATLHADTIKLKSGKEYKGSIISQDDKSYLFEIQVTNSITDERRINKDDVSEILADPKDADAYKAVSHLVPTPDLLSEKSYKARIKLAQSFLRMHPKSKHVKEVKSSLDTLTKELKTISTGGIKLDGQMISHADIEANAYDIDARILTNKMKKLAKSAQYKLALRQWELIQRDYTCSLAYKESVPLVPSLFKAYETKLEQLTNTLDTRMEKRKAMLASLEDNDHKRATRIIEDKQKAHETLVTKEKEELKTKWLSVDPYDKSSIDSSLQLVTNELQSLSQLNPSTIKLAGPDLRAAWTALAKGSLDEATQRIQVISRLRVPQKYVTPLTLQLKEKKVSQAEEQKAKEEAILAAKKKEADAIKKAEAEGTSPKGNKKK